MVQVILQRALANQEKELRWYRKEENKWLIIFKSLTSKVTEILLQKTIIWKDEEKKLIPTPKKTGSLVLQSILLVETEIGTTFPEGNLTAHSKAFNVCSLLTQQLQFNKQSWAFTAAHPLFIIMKNRKQSKCSTTKTC